MVENILAKEFTPGSEIRSPFIHLFLSTYKDRSSLEFFAGRMPRHLSTWAARQLLITSHMHAEMHCNVARAPDLPSILE